jgi:hypothetical protein
MDRPQVPDCDITVVIRVLDDEERVGHVVRRLATHLRSLKRSFEFLVADEGSGDNTLAVTALLRRQVAELEVLHAAPDRGYLAACERARGRTILLYDARSDAPLGALGFALGRLADGAEVVAVSGRYLVFRRTRAWRAFDALVQRTHAEVERRFVKRARTLGLACELTHARRRTPWAYLRDKLLPQALIRL